MHRPNVQFIVEDVKFTDEASKPPSRYQVAVKKQRHHETSNWPLRQVRQVQQGNRKNRVSSDNPTPPWSDYPANAAGSSDAKKARSDYASSYSLESLVSQSSNFLQGRMIRRVHMDRRTKVRIILQRGCFLELDFLLQDRMIRRSILGPSD